MPRIHLPALVELTCTSCGKPMTVESHLINGRSSVHCPFCRFEYNIYDGLSGQLRRQIYHALRDEIERRVYEQHQMNHPDYFEDEGNVR
jgi:hypothetical protein